MKTALPLTACTLLLLVSNLSATKRYVDVSQSDSTVYADLDAARLAPLLDRVGVGL